MNIIDKVKSIFQSLKKQLSDSGGTSQQENLQGAVISPGDTDKQKRDQNLQSIKGTPLETVAKNFLEIMKTLNTSNDRKKLAHFTFSQSKGLIALVLDMITYEILNCEVYKTLSTKVARFTVQINMKKKSKEYILMARPLPSTGEWRIYSFEDKSKILVILKNWSDFLKDFPDKGIMRSSAGIPLEIGVALMQYGEDESALEYFTKTLEQDQTSDESLAARVCLSILRGRAN
ncbi:MAG: hypothetical protein ABRQ39_05655 [Candidatus Eremiobacterota bacterium]